MGFGLGFLFLFVCLLAFKTPLISTVSHFEVFLEFSEFLCKIWGSKPFGVLGSHGKGKVLWLPLKLLLAGGPPQPEGKGDQSTDHFVFTQKQYEGA